MAGKPFGSTPVVSRARHLFCLLSLRRLRGGARASGEGKQTPPTTRGQDARCFPGGCSVLLCSIRFGPVRFGSLRVGSVRLGSVLFSRCSVVVLLLVPSECGESEIKALAWRDRGLLVDDSLMRKHTVYNAFLLLPRFSTTVFAHLCMKVNIHIDYLYTSYILRSISHIYLV